MCSVKDPRFCGFCGKDFSECKKLIAGPNVFICDECISLSVSIIQESDTTYFTKLKMELKQTKQWKDSMKKTIEGSEEFWELMDADDIYTRMASALLRSEIDLNDNLMERAHQLMSKARTASRAAWKLIHEQYPEYKGVQMSATHGDRKIYIHD